MWKAFWSSLGADLKDAFVGHWLRVVGWAISYLGPFAFFVAAYMTRKPDKPQGLAVPIAIGVVAVPLLLIYWLKLRRWVSEKLQASKAVNEIDSSRHYAAIVLFELMKGVMEVATIMVSYYAVKWVEGILPSASMGILVVAILYALGALLTVLDSMLTLAPKDTQIKIEDAPKDKK